MITEQSAYPLSWPISWPRTPSHQRERGSFEGTPDRVRRDMLAEIDRIALGREARTHTIRDYIIVSTNMPLRRDGEPMASRNEPVDPGVAVYFKRKGKQMCFACDKYDRVWKNMRSIHKTIEALRGIERWGSSQMMERAFTGFAALPPPTSEQSNCWTILELPFGSTVEQINDRYRHLSQVRHPDRGGSHDAMAALNKARQEALAAVKGRP